MLRVLAVVLAFLLIAPWTAARCGATEIGDYLREMGVDRDSVATQQYLRVDSLSENNAYSARQRGEPESPWYAPLQPTDAFKQGMPPLLLPDFSRSDPNDPYRHIGKGHPLEGTSWRNRPYHVGWLFGGLYGDRLTDELDHTEDLFGGYRFGCDFDHYWGAEARFAFARLELLDTERSAQLPSSRTQFYDASLLYYPWGDAKWRPFASAGLGWARFSYIDGNRNLQHDQSVTMPLSIGLKYYWKKWLSLRGALVDNIAFASKRVSTQHNLSLTFGVEYRFNHSRRIYGSW